MRPVSSHSKQITDFCSWNGLLVLCGVRSDATNDGHVFRDEKHKTASGSAESTTSGNSANRSVTAVHGCKPKSKPESHRIRT